MMDYIIVNIYAIGCFIAFYLVEKEHKGNLDFAMASICACTSWIAVIALLIDHIIRKYFGKTTL